MTVENMGQTCKRCRFYKPSIVTLGKCLFNPPSISGDYRGCWPFVDHDSWCGRFVGDSSWEEAEEEDKQQWEKIAKDHEALEIVSHGVTA